MLLLLGLDDDGALLCQLGRPNQTPQGQEAATLVAPSVRPSVREGGKTVVVVKQTGENFTSGGGSEEP